MKIIKVILTFTVIGFAILVCVVGCFVVSGVFDLFTPHTWPVWMQWSIGIVLVIHICCDLLLAIDRWKRKKKVQVK